MKDNRELSTREELQIQQRESLLSYYLSNYSAELGVLLNGAGKVSVDILTFFLLPSMLQSMKDIIVTRAELIQLRLKYQQDYSILNRQIRDLLAFYNKAIAFYKNFDLKKYEESATPSKLTLMSEAMSSCRTDIQSILFHIGNREEMAFSEEVAHFVFEGVFSFALIKKDRDPRKRALSPDNSAYENNKTPRITNIFMFYSKNAEHYLKPRKLEGSLRPILVSQVEAKSTVPEQSPNVYSERQLAFFRMINSITFRNQEDRKLLANLLLLFANFFFRSPLYPAHIPTDFIAFELYRAVLKMTKQHQVANDEILENMYQAADNNIVRLIARDKSKKLKNICSVDKLDDELMQKAVEIFNNAIERTMLQLSAMLSANTDILESIKRLESTKKLEPGKILESIKRLESSKKLQSTNILELTIDVMVGDLFTTIIKNKALGRRSEEICNHMRRVFEGKEGYDKAQATADTAFQLPSP